MSSKSSKSSTAILSPAQAEAFAVIVAAFQSGTLAVPEKAAKKGKGKKQATDQVFLTSENRRDFIADHDWAEAHTSTNALSKQIADGAPLVGNWALSPYYVKKYVTGELVATKKGKKATKPTAGKKGKRAGKKAKTPKVEPKHKAQVYRRAQHHRPQDRVGHPRGPGGAGPEPRRRRREDGEGAGRARLTLTSTTSGLLGQPAPPDTDDRSEGVHMGIKRFREGKRLAPHVHPRPERGDLHPLPPQAPGDPMTSLADLLDPEIIAAMRRPPMPDT
jgi:hypothetical protein